MQLLWVAPVDAGFVCDKDAVLREIIKETPFKTVHVKTNLQCSLRNNLLFSMPVYSKCLCVLGRARIFVTAGTHFFVMSHWQ
jgi:hypothetical protein